VPRTFLFRLGVLVVLSCGLAHLGDAASFDCAKARTPNEVLVCRDSQLSAMDDELGAMYTSARAVTTDLPAFRKQTKDEWRRRESCTDRDCLVTWYQRRRAQLEVVLKRSRPAEPAASAPVATTASPPVTAPPSPADDSFSVSPVLVLLVGVLGGLWIRGKVLRGKQIIATAQAKRGDTAEVEIDSAMTKNEQIRRLSAPARGVSSIRTPSAPIPTVWIRAGQTVTVCKMAVNGGMLYVGSTLRAPDGTVEPAQIDPTLEVDPTAVAPNKRCFGYWPRYHDISPTGRRAYLTWLVDGRQDPTADIGYVFLFFYGLERRVLVDAAADATAKAEIPLIVAEIQRLRGIYDNNSFLRYSSGLLDFLEADSVDSSLHQESPPPSTSNRGMSLRLKLGLGQFAVVGKPVSPDWALAWARSDANLRVSRVATRCARQFDAHFRAVYRERLGEGLKLAVNRTKLQISYRPASAGLLKQSYTSSLSQLPDVTTVVTPLKKIQAIVDEAVEGLEAYSRYIGRHSDRVLSLEATLLLPRALWPDEVRMAFQGLEKRIGDGMVVIKLNELLGAFGGTAKLTRETLRHLLELLQRQHVGVEPDVLAGAKTPKPEDSVVLFRLVPDDLIRSLSKEGRYKNSDYDAIAVMLDLAITLANADGKISGREVQFLNAQVNAWSHVGASAQRRLRARLRLGIVYPPTLSALKSRIEPLPAAARAALGKLLSALALADGKLRPAAVRHLEKLYQLLGLDASVLYNQLHGASAALDKRAIADSAPPSGEQSNPTRAQSPVAARQHGLQLDAARVAALQAESERVTILLSKVFEEQAQESATVAVVSAAEHDEPESAEREPRMLGLDPEHSAFLRALLTRPSWTRTEAGDIAADMELMLDGALERVNEAALDAFDQRIAEGDDPIEIAQELMEQVSA
jgi:uncharacterized protein/uncharacterized tellurite resistance protein B-like protein